MFKDAVDIAFILAACLVKYLLLTSRPVQGIVSYLTAALQSS